MINHFTTNGMLCQEQIAFFLLFLAIHFKKRAIFTTNSLVSITKLDFLGDSCYGKMKDRFFILSVFVIFSTKEAFFTKIEKFFPRLSCFFRVLMLYLR